MSRYLEQTYSAFGWGWQAVLTEQTYDRDATYDFLPLVENAKRRPEPEHDEYPLDWYCPNCGRAMKREYYSAALPNRGVPESFRRVCERGHWWGYTKAGL